MTAAHDTTIVAIVGAGPLARAMLETLMGVASVEIRCVFSADPDAPALALARENGIRCHIDGRIDGHVEDGVDGRVNGRVVSRFDVLAADAEVNLILETTGEPDVLTAVEAAASPNSLVLDAAATRGVLRLLSGQRESLERDITRRENAEKARYLRQASHQIKSPLSSIQSSVNVILGGYTGEIPERTREVMEKIHARCDAALSGLAKRRLLADLRCVDHDGLEMDSVRLATMVREAVDLHAALASQRGVEIQVAPHDVPDLARWPDLVRCDHQKMVALLSELVENAVVYSEEHGVVEVSVDARPDGRLMVAVRDHGIGIPERCLPRIFDEDYRADPAVQHYLDGVGLGLTIAREIADLHGFDLTAQSEEGRGSVFTLSVPAAPAVP